MRVRLGQRSDIRILRLECQEIQCEKNASLADIEVEENHIQGTCAVGENAKKKYFPARFERLGKPAADR
jgi:hypothetical protein